jgi:ABC-type dipeptide/oligopeptide/nickel transport system permease component
VSDLRTDLERVIAQVDLVEKEQSKHAPTIDKPIQTATVRFVVTRWVVGSFLGYAIVAGIFIMNHVGNESAKPQIDQLMDIMKTLLLPIVTLVIGFYFGSKETN